MTYWKSNLSKGCDHDRNSLWHIHSALAAFCLFLMTGSTCAQTVYPLSDTELARRIADKEQLTDVPTIYIDIQGITTEQELAATLYKIRKSNENGEEIAPYSDATITVVDNSAEDSPQHLTGFTDAVQIKVRGNSTASAPNGKLPYRLKFASKKTSPDGVAHKHDLLGLGYEKRNWTLIANNYDRSLIRNAITYHLGEYVGMDFNPGYKFVDLVICGLYRGSYQVSDHCEVGKNRIDIDEDNDWYLEFSCWGSMAEEPYVGQGDGDDHFVSIKNPDTDDMTDEEIASLKTAVQAWRKEWIASFNNGTWTKYNDLESFVKFYIAIEITGDLDGYFVFKGYRTPGGPFFWGPLWDKDLAYGNTTYAQADLTAYNGKTNFEYIFRNTLFKNKKFLTLAKAKIDELIAEGLYDKLASDIDNIVSSMEGSRLQNYEKWDIDAASMASEVYTMADYDEHVATLKSYIQNRIGFVQQRLQGLIDELPPAADADYNPENPWWSTGLSTGTDYNLTLVNRTLTGGEWNTFCLPFDASQVQMEQALGCSYRLKVHSGMGSDGVTMLFDSPASLDVEAGVPYLICPDEDVNSFGKFEDAIYSVNVTNDSSNPYNGEAVTFDNLHYFCASLFHGYELSTTTDYLFGNDLYVDDTSLAKTTVNNQKGCRAFIRMPEGETPAVKFIQETPAVEISYDVTDEDSPDNCIQYNGQKANVTILGRKIVYGGEWNAICLPFDAGEDVMTSVFGNDVKLQSLTSVADLSTEEGTNIEITFTKISPVAVEAGKPYIIKPSSDVSELIFNGVTFNCSAAHTDEVGGWQFVGTLSPIILPADQRHLVLMRNNELMLVGKTGQLHGGRAYFIMPETDTNIMNVQMLMDGESDGIQYIITDEVGMGNADVYNTAGQRMDRHLPLLPKGVYVVNGKKIIK